MLDWLDMGSLHFGPASAIAQLQTGQGAAVTVRLAHFATEGDVPVGSAQQPLDPWALKRLLFVVELVPSVPSRFKRLKIGGQPSVDDSGKLCVGQPSNSQLLSAT